MLNFNNIHNKLDNKIKDTNSSKDITKPPSISLPKGGGAIRDIGEKFAAHPATGTGSINAPIFTSPGRSGFGPQLSLSYNSGSGNESFGFGWSISVPSITRKTDKGLPRYQDIDETDVFILSEAEDLVPVFKKDLKGDWIHDQKGNLVFDEEPRDEYIVRHYRPRIEGLFARIERWTNKQTGDVHWRSISRDNITTLYGKTIDARIADPMDKSHIFSWLICESYDDKGNAIIYEYKKEDSANVDFSLAHERNRSDLSRSTNRYLKRIRYGNLSPYQIGEDLSQRTDWLFEVVFDYGEHDTDAPAIQEIRPWPVRQDAFSTYRAGFEIRTYRLGHRVLMFHHFPEELGVDDYLVRSTDIAYNENPIASFITGITQSGYVRMPDGKYLKRSFPPIEFEYSQANIHDEIKVFDEESLKNLPYGIDGNRYRWVDLDGEGISGILTEQADAWFYKPNLGGGQLGDIELVAKKPSLVASNSGRQQLMDLAGDGQLDLVQFSDLMPGFYERTDDQSWKQFTPFDSLSNVDWNDPNLKFIDLTGDGHIDILIAYDEVFTWYPSLAEEGFGSSEDILKPHDEEKGPMLVFADSTQSIFLADMSGDGLVDIVRIRNGEICYWPNLGYGHFGARVTMDNSPWFDTPDQFDQRRIRLADIDGSGTTDIIYLGRDSARIYLNQSGNSLSEAQSLTQFPASGDIDSVTIVDLFGNGTGCIVWSSPLPSNEHRQMRYMDLMGGVKPHLLVAVRNNMGAETHVQYAPSTKFYLADKAAGTPWITRLPFPVQVVERVETYDRISRNRFVTRYAYHHGYFDGIEREFRGFGRVEQLDTEEFASLSTSGSFPVGSNIDEASHVPPVLTKIWFHTGAYLDESRISRHFEDEYYREPGLTDDQFHDMLLPDTLLPPDVSSREACEATRALKGSILRQEIYALDGSENSLHPYSVSERNFDIMMLQPKENNHYAVFFAHPRETIDYHYERNPSDPRTSHSLILEVDAFGNILKSAAFGYGRRQPDTTLTPTDQAKQTQILVTYIENSYTDSIDADDDYRTPLPCETQRYDLTGLVLSAGSMRVSFSEVSNAVSAAIPIAYETVPSQGILQKRLIERTRILYRKNDLSGPLPLCQIESMALPYENYKQAFTPGLLSQIYGTKIADATLIDDGRYVHSDGDTNWWIPSGRLFYSPGSTDTPMQELAFARQHFFLPHRYRDPFHTGAISTETIISYDVYNLMVQQTRDAVGNLVTAGERKPNGDLDPTIPGHDYRVLQPRQVMDPNRNRTAVAFDALGMVVETAVMGKPEDSPPRGDLLNAAIHADPTQAEIDQFFADPKGPVTALLLGNATTRIIYDLTGYYRETDLQKKPPVFAATIARETHASDAAPQGGLKIQVSFSYSDGFGREIQKKIQAEPGPVIKRDPATGRIATDNCPPEMTPNDVNPRWVGSGWTIYNNKAKPVRQYEPFFTDTHRFEFDVRVCVSPVLFYDPVDRVVATLHPNHTWEKVVFGPWRQETWDVNDTVSVDDPKRDPDVGDFFRRLPDPDYLPLWYAQRQGGALGPQEQSAAFKAAIHANTPTVVHFDTLGRTILTVSHNKFKRSDAPPADPPVEEFYSTHIFLDIEGNQREIRDERKNDQGILKERVVMRYDYDMLSNRIHQTSMEAGERWMLNDVAGKPIYSWDSRDHQFRTAYDPIRRPVQSYLIENLTEGSSSELLVGRTVYGETQINPEAKNLRGKAYQVFDQAGIVTSDEYDFKGNLLKSSRRLATDYKNTLNWLSAIGLEVETFTSSTAYDALNRPVELTVPHSDKPGTEINILRPSYNEANLLESIEANLHGAVTAIPFVTDIDYNAKGQRTQIIYGSGARADRQGVTTTYTYDPLTFRLIHLLTLRNAIIFPKDCPEPPPAGWSGCQVQNLSYTYDPAGNITHIQDDAQQTIYFRNRKVEPSAEYTYDAIYWLIEATGREHLGQVGGAPQPHSYDDRSRVGLDWSANDGNAMGRYIESYVYDAAGNVLAMQHRGSDPSNPGWTRTYNYHEASLIEPSKMSNRLSSTTIGINNPQVCQYKHDIHGNMVRMPHLANHPNPQDPNMHWDYKDQLQQVDLGVGGTAYYMYDATGQRIRKVVEKSPGLTEERIYLGGFEIFRRLDGGGAVTLEREALHVMDDKQHFALVEKRIHGVDSAPEELIRYQIGNHLGSSIFELDDQAQIISYEEYTPYGSTSYQAVRSQIETPKRYRYTGRERDDETGLYYHRERYYAPWLGRWASCDPRSLVDGLNLYRYSRNNPARLMDPTGTDPIDPTIPTEPQGFGLTLQGNQLRIGPLTPYPTSTRERNPLSSGFQFQLGGKQLNPHGELFIGGGRPADRSETLPEPSSTGTERAPVPGTLRATAQELARPESITGVRPRGTLHLWSGQEAKEEAKAAIQSSKSGWMMGDIEGAPTPEHAAGETEFAEARARAPGGRLTQAEFERIWGPRSASVVGRGAFAGHPVESHGTPAPTSIQSRYELPARAIGGGAAGGLFFGTGMFTAITGGQDPNPAVAISLVLSGVGEAASGIAFGSGAILGATEAMAIGAAGGTFFGGAGAAIGFGAASIRSFSRGDIAGGVVNALGAVGGVLMIASLFTPIGWIGLLGLGLAAFAAGFNLGRWLRD